MYDAIISSATGRAFEVRQRALLEQVWGQGRPGRGRGRAEGAVRGKQGQTRCGCWAVARACSRLESHWPRVARSMLVSPGYDMETGSLSEKSSFGMSIRWACLSQKEGEGGRLKAHQAFVLLHCVKTMNIINVGCAIH